MACLAGTESPGFSQQMKSDSGCRPLMNTMPGAGERSVFVRIAGIVQGVGFRPFIYQLAHRYELTGWVRNQADGVLIEATGLHEKLDSFLRDISAKAPPLAKITQLEVADLPYEQFEGFSILKSDSHQSRRTLISPDVCTCQDCLRELLDPGDRRYRYPFINCTNCGPRYTIIQDIPYDRGQTTMAAFPMCSECRREYEDPLNRRFHAQPNACWECGPQVWLEDDSGRLLAKKDQAIRRGIRLLEQGKILAIKGLGGFHLAVLATDEVAVSRLRRRKIREEKPFALMFGNVEAIQQQCNISAEEIKLLRSPQRPIVLVKKNHQNAAASIAPSVAPGNRFVGAFLPYTPLHCLLFEQSSCDVLVMTSGNQSDEPIVMANDDARLRLNGIADYFLFHDRDIYMRCDDSVVRVLNQKPRPVRRARGYVPVPIFLSKKAPSLLGVGAELKNTVCLTRENEAFLSQHIGDLENLETLRSFEHAVEHLKRILEIDPKWIVHDLHPDYLSTQWAMSQTDLPRLAVQHHHAHIASVLAERHIEEPVIGLALDGSGYGTDGTIWGGEILRVDGCRFERLAHFRQVLLPGGEKAIKEPWRMAVSYLWSLDPVNVLTTYGDVLNRWPLSKVQVLIQMLNKGLNSPITSSCGRLFDAISALAGLRDSVNYEGQAAIELEQALKEGDEEYRGEVVRKNDVWVLDPFPMVASAIRDVRVGKDSGMISSRFHNGLVSLLVEAVEKISRVRELRRIALSGGVFQNAYLSERLERQLAERGFEVFTHVEVPANDACISLGQAYIGAQKYFAGEGL